MDDLIMTSKLEGDAVFRGTNIQGFYLRDVFSDDLEDSHFLNED
jgi:hypothetical protein